MLATDSLKSVSKKAIHKAAESISQYVIQSEIIQITETATKKKKKKKEKKKKKKKRKEKKDIHKARKAAANY